MAERVRHPAGDGRRPRGRSGIKTHGYQVAPTIYLVGPDGKVCWTDGRARMQHKGPKGWEKTPDDAIAAIIDPPATP